LTNSVGIALESNVQSAADRSRSLKLITVMLNSAKACLGGKYVNFGIMKLYGDDSMDLMLATCHRAIVSASDLEILVNIC
jgi:hypothetical protein